MERQFVELKSLQATSVKPMAEQLDNSEKQAPKTDQSADLSKDTNNPSKASDGSKSKSVQKFKIPKIGFPKLAMPKIGFPKFRFDRLVAKKRNFLWLWLLIILASYTCMGYFLSILMTIPSRKNLAIAGFAIVALLPMITAFADYALMKWGYLISGLLIVGGLLFLLKLKFYFIVLAFMSWIGITAIAFVGESLLKQKHKFLIAIIILTIPCLMGLGIGWQIWKLATQWS